MAKTNATERFSFSAVARLHQLTVSSKWAKCNLLTQQGEIYDSIVYHRTGLVPDNTVHRQYE